MIEQHLLAALIRQSELPPRCGCLPEPGRPQQHHTNCALIALCKAINGEKE